MQLGQVIDYCIAYNERHKEESANNAGADKKHNKKSPKKYRKATSDEIKAYFG